MKNYCILLALCCGLYACNKEPVTPQQEAEKKNTGTVTAVINGQKKWVSDYASFASNKKNGFNLLGRQFSGGIVRQGFGFINVKLNLGEKQKLYYELTEDGYMNMALEDSTGGYFSTMEHDAVEAYYYVLDSSDSYVIVDEYDAANQRLKGRFQAIMFTTDKPTQGYSDTLRIVDGTFDVGLQKQE